MTYIICDPFKSVTWTQFATGKNNDVIKYYLDIFDIVTGDFITSNSTNSKFINKFQQGTSYEAV